MTNSLRVCTQTPSELIQQLSSVVLCRVKHEACLWGQISKKPDPAPLKETLDFTVMTDFKRFATVAPDVTSFLPKMEEPSNPDDWGGGASANAADQRESDRNEN